MNNIKNKNSDVNIPGSKANTFVSTSTDPACAYCMANGCYSNRTM